jgi:glycosyltransferase involved in cell wall biosynthesis
MANRIRKLVEDGGLRKRMSMSAAERAKFLFDLERQIDDYLSLFKGLLANYDSEFKSSWLRD